MPKEKQTMSNERDFKGVWIPKEIWLSKDLSPIEKFFLLEIESLDNENGCYASNSHFSELFGLSKGRCTQIIKGLERKNIITVHLEKEGKLIKKRTLRVVNILNRGIKYIKQGYLENDEGNNTKEQYKEISMSEKKFSDDDMKLSKFIFTGIIKLNPDHKPPDFDKWADTIRLMRERDERTHKQIQDVYLFAHGDDFWKTNILCPDSLRKNFDKLETKRKNNPSVNTLSDSYINQHAKPGESYAQARARLSSSHAP